MTKTRSDVQELIEFGPRYIYRDNHENSEHNRICSEHMDLTMKRFITKMGSLFVSSMICLIGPVHAYFAYGVKTSTVEFHIPNCEPKSNTEFLINAGIQCARALWGISYYFGMETTLTLVENVATIGVKLTETELIEVIQMHKNKSIDELTLRRRMGSIVDFFQKVDK